MRKSCPAVGLALALALAGGSGEAKAAPARHILSLNLCADQYLLRLADREQIAVLTSLARDPAMSAEAALARDVALSRGTAEEVLVIAPDLIVAGPGRTAATLGRRALQYPTLELDSAETYVAITAQIRQVAAAVGHVARGEALVRRMDADLARVPSVGRGRVAAYYQRRGFLTGTGTLVDELMRRVGLDNLARRLGKPALSALSLEELVAARPDFLIVEQASGQADDRGTEMLDHPVLRNIPRLYLPRAWTVCGSPAYVRAAQALARQIAHHP